MYTQCPHCLTLFRISSQELKAAAGKARCCQCNQIFNALETLQESPVPQNDPAQQLDYGNGQEPFPSEEQAGQDSLFTDTLNLEHEQLIEQESLAPEPTQTGDELFTIRDDGLETEPDYLAGGSESQMSDLLDKDSTPSINTTDIADTEAKIIRFEHVTDATTPAVTIAHEESGETRDTAANDTATVDKEQEKRLFRFTELQKDEQPPIPRNPAGTQLHVEDMFEKQHTSFSSIAWGIAGLLLVCVLFLQLSWLYRDQVIQYEAGRQLLSQVCNIAGCIVPKRRDTSQIFVQHRDLRGHPNKPDALLLQLRMINRADFAQPFPKLHLSLFNDRDKLIAQRTFEPLEYVSDPKIIDNLMPQSEPIFISMELLDPGKDVTGFKFDFL